MNAALEPTSGKWLHALPSTYMKTMLDNNTLRIASALRLGAEVCGLHSCAHCGSPVSPTGEHALSCIKAAGRFSRHSLLNQTIAESMRSAGIEVQLEPSGLCVNNLRRPDGRTLMPFKDGRFLVWDATVSFTLANSYRHLASKRAGEVANMAENNKLRKYRELEASFIVQPVAIETMGVFGEKTLAFLTDLCRRVSAATHQPRAGEYLLQRLSIEVQRGNSVAIQESVPRREGLPELFFNRCIIYHS